MKDELETGKEGIKDNDSSQLRYNLFFAQTIIYQSMYWYYLAQAR